MSVKTKTKDQKKKLSQLNYQIDQSGKVEHTNKDTVVALSNDHHLAILLKSKTKRIIKEWFKKEKRIRFFPFLTFAALLAILIKISSPKKRIEIDREYFGHENLVSERVTTYLNLLGMKKHPPLEWGHVGKTSQAHNLGLRIAKDKVKPNKVVSLEEVMELLTELKEKKLKK